MNHAGISTGCATCHATGKTFYGVTVVTPPATHIPIGAAACESCHAPAKFTNFSGTAMNHAGISSGCATCHATGKSFYGVTIVTPPATHIPVGAAACESCHAPAQFTNFGSTPMNHAPVAGTACATCHETGKTWYGVTIVTRPTTAQDPNHPTTGDCASCHSSTTSFMAGITTKPANHIPTTQACALCHTTPGNYAVATMNHTGITSGCATCHATGLTFANIVPVSPPATHIPSGATPCETCHAPAKFTNFSGTAMNHAGITAGCATCHATGKSFFGVTVVTPPPTHIPSGATACETCHAPAKFTNFAGTAMNHSGISTGCATCHATGKSFYGVTIVTPPATHIPVGAAVCESCHAPAKFTNFGGTAMNHAPVSRDRVRDLPRNRQDLVRRDHRDPADRGAGRRITRPRGDCGTCHSSTTSFTAGVTTKPANHIPTTQACALCHTTPGNYAVATHESHRHHAPAVRPATRPG